MSKKVSTKTLVFGALLTALSFIIPMTFPRLVFLPPPFSVTFASHVPTLLAMLISPVMAAFTVLGSTVSFIFSTSDFVIPLRAASHIIFALLGCMMLKKGVNMYLTLGLMSIVHALGEVIAVYAFTSAIELADKGGMFFLWGTVFGITIFHHIVDCVITVPVFKALKKAKLL